jgi:hypothetical protein
MSMKIEEAVEVFTKAHKPDRINADYIKHNHGSVQDYMEDYSEAGDLGRRYVEVSQFDSVDGTTKLVEWYEDTYQIAYHNTPESERLTPESCMGEISFEPDFDKAVEAGVKLLRKPNAFDVTVTEVSDGEIGDDVDLAEALDFEICLELIWAYETFRCAAYDLMVQIGDTEGEDAACAAEYPFSESFDDVTLKILGWCEASEERLKK